MIENFVLGIILMIICLIMCWKPVPLIGIPFSLVTIFIAITVFMFDETLPTGIYFAVIVSLTAIGAIWVNAEKVRH